MICDMKKIDEFFHSLRFNIYIDGKQQVRHHVIFFWYILDQLTGINIIL